MDDIFKPISDNKSVVAQKALEYRIKEKANNIIIMMADFVIPHIGVSEIEYHLDDLSLCFHEQKILADINSEEEFLEWVNMFLGYYRFLKDTKLARKLFKNPYKNHFDELVIRRDYQQVSKG